MENTRSDYIHLMLYAQQQMLGFLFCFQTQMRVLLITIKNAHFRLDNQNNILAFKHSTMVLMLSHSSQWLIGYNF